MDTKILKVERNKVTAGDLNEAGNIIRAGGLVGFPTETVYGLGGNALDKEASKKIYAAKGRPSDNPLIVHIAEPGELAPLVCEIPAVAEKLMDKYWPGPMTLIFKKSSLVPDETTGGLDTVAIRMPSHPVARALIRASRVPIAAPSGNLSGRPSPTKAEHMIEDMNGRIDMIIDGGSCDIGLESTIIDVTGEMPELLRPGYISIEDIKKLTGEGKVDPTVLSKPAADLRPKAPGMKYRHYAPKAPLTLVEGDMEAVVNKINEFTAQALAQGKKAGVICSSETAEKYHGGEIMVIGSRSKGEEVAYNLFDVLRRMDQEEVSEIYSESFGDSGMGMAIMNRMLKAAGYNVIKV